MGDFETVMKMTMELLGVILLAGACFGVATAIRTGWKRGSAISGPGGDTRNQLADLQTRIDELERRALTSGETNAQYDRIAELEERVDFAERLLAKGDVVRERLPEAR
ncbi:MAG TPA: hypothetical protein VHW65_05750 [Gemmatimonadales bacterium]|nr:hypothetical protein [Gemmatimonadales bacterium]